MEFATIINQPNHATLKNTATSASSIESCVFISMPQEVCTRLRLFCTPKLPFILPALSKKITYFNTAQNSHRGQPQPNPLHCTYCQISIIIIYLVPSTYCHSIQHYTDIMPLVAISLLSYRHNKYGFEVNVKTTIYRACSSKHCVHNSTTTIYHHPLGSRGGSGVLTLKTTMTQFWDRTVSPS